MKKLIFGLIGVVLIVSAVLFFTNRPIMNQDPLTNNSSNTNNSNTPSPTTGTTRVNMDMTSWKTYRSDDLAVEFKYPSEWSLEGGVSLNAECFG
ncbi:MAG TPA: hypothetical protein VD998_04080, partial [Verrucomicrobiae bacterium]|nr:hypothetical protein [Verrucomicrobiae bacterium]